MLMVNLPQFIPSKIRHYAFRGALTFIWLVTGVVLFKVLLSDMMRDLTFTSWDYTCNYLDIEINHSRVCRHHKNHS